MAEFLQAAFFDVDGVLIDSLPQHLQICRDKAKEFGLNLAIPTTEGMRRLISRGVKVSPMINFFIAVGFPQAAAEKADADYRREFMQRYRPPLFPGVGVMLSDLRKAGLRLGLVTANTRANVAPVLGRAIRCFEQSSLFFFDEYPPSMTKSDCLEEGARRLGTRPSSCAYIGDQPADAIAARDAGFRFLGVTFGWGILPGTDQFETAGNPAEIEDKLVGAHAPA